MSTISPASLLAQAVTEAARINAADILWVYNCSPSFKVNDHLVKWEAAGVLNDETLAGIVKELVSAEKAETLKNERQVDLAYADGEHRFRVNIFYQRGHISIVMRYVRSQIRTLDELGLPNIIRDLVGNDNGLILMVGPTGSGKSTSLAAMIDHINTNSDKHIITIEDPIEYMYENKQSIIEQRELGTDAVSFPAALRSALREAPDVILLGEMRDLESISTAITVAETGHLVFSTIHANTAPGTIDRIVDIFQPGGKDQIRIQLADILIAVLSQRLVPRADGNGSMAIVETMIANNAVRNAIRTGNTAQLANVIQTSSGEGMFLLDDLLVKAVKRQEITKETALSFANDRNEVRRALGTV